MTRKPTVTERERGSMLSLNKVFLIGNLTRDPRLRTTPSGISVGEFSIAVNDMYRTSSGESRERTVFVDIVVWKRLAENCYRFLTKGRAALVEGRLEQDTWEDRETGQRRSRLRVVAQNVTFLYRPGEQVEKPKDDNFGDEDSRRRNKSGRRGNYRSDDDPYTYDTDAPKETNPQDEKTQDTYGLEDDRNDVPGDEELPF